MTNDEFGTLVRNLFSQFPGFENWLTGNVPDVAKTQRFWFEALQKFSLDECNHVCVGWLRSGAKPWYGNIIDQLRESVEFERDERYRKSNAQANKRAESERMQRFVYCRENPMQEMNMAESMQKMRRCKDMAARGELDPHDANRIIHGILQSVV